MFIISAGVEESGIIQTLGERIYEWTGDSDFKLLLYVTLFAGLIAGFINNTQVVALFIPLVKGIAKRKNSSPSKFLIPLSFAAMMGGLTTLIGTSTNILASDILARRTGEGFSMFEFTHLGLLVLFIGIIYMLFVGRKILPERRKATREFMRKVIEISITLDIYTTGGKMKMTFKDKEIIEFWFEELTPKQWFNSSEELDAKIYERFGAVHNAATKGEFDSWRSTPEGSLAEIIVLDQFSRNIYRGKPGAFANDLAALVLAQEAIRKGFHIKLETFKRSFFYMPFMHSESLLIHKNAVRLFNEPGMEDYFDYEIKHKNIIERFGRFPHRNEILGRNSTPEEIEFLSQPGSSF